MHSNYRFTVIEQQQQAALRRAQRRRATNYVMTSPVAESQRTVDVVATDYDHAREQLNLEIRARKFPQQGQRRDPDA